MNYQQIIEANYDVKIEQFTLLDSHFGTDIFLAVTDTEKLIVKNLPRYMEHVKNEGVVTDFLRSHGMKVAELLKSKDGNHILTLEDGYMSVQKFIEGQTFELNSAPDWFLEQSAVMLGKINERLQGYDDLPLRFGSDFFSKSTALGKLNYFKAEVEKIKADKPDANVEKWEEQIKHLEKIVTFNIDTDQLTYANSHGDYNISQAIVKDGEITIIDWAAVCKLPVCFEVMTSYVFASIKCAEGVISAEDFKRYIAHYTKHFSITEYDLKTMPYVFYYWHCVCNYKPDEEIPENYQPIANLTRGCMNWLFENVETLSLELVGP